MKNKKFNLTLRPSRYFFTLISGMHLVILLLACIASFAWWLLLCLLIFIAISYFYLIRRYIYRKYKYTVVQLWQDPESDDPHNWLLLFSSADNKQPVVARLKSKGYLSDLMIVMHFTIARKSISVYRGLQSGKMLGFANLLKYLKTINVPVMIFPDMLDYKDYQALKMSLIGY